MKSPGMLPIHFQWPGMEFKRNRRLRSICGSAIQSRQGMLETLIQVAQALLGDCCWLPRTALCWRKCSFAKRTGWGGVIRNKPLGCRCGINSMLLVSGRHRGGRGLRQPNSWILERKVLGLQLAAWQVWPFNQELVPLITDVGRLIVCIDLASAHA